MVHDNRWLEKFATKNRQFIEEADLQPGDVIWYGKSSGNHMMMYAGNGQVIHAKGAKLRDGL